MRVAHVIAAPLYGTENVYGGAERYALELALAMSSHTPTSLIALGRTRTRERRADLQIVRLRNWIPWRRFVFDGINPTLACELRRYDIVHVHQRHCMTGDYCLVHGLLSGQRVHATIHGGYGYGLHRIANLDDKFACHLHVSKFSQTMAQHSQYVRASTIGVGVDLYRFRPSREERCRDVVFVGRLLPHKGIDVLIQAAGPDVPVRIIGRRATHAQQYYEYLKRLACGRNVRIEENVDDEGVINALGSAMCVVLPSVYRSCFGEVHRVPELVGQTLLEAMACGTPVVCTDVGGMPEIVQEGVTGHIVAPNDPDALRAAILKLAGDRGAANEMGRQARAHVESKYSWSIVVERCLREYESSLQ